jgi:hypothetical protein
MRGALRAINVACALVALASALAVLGSGLLEPGYREAHGDSLAFVLAYIGWQVLVAWAFARDFALVPWLALAKLLAAWAFLATFAVAGPYWMAWTPGRYVYQLFDWGVGAEIGLFALVWIGRGAWNTLNALYFTAPWWGPLRRRHPLVGRLVTAAAIGLVVFCLWTFRELVRVAHVRDVARAVFDQLDCATIRTHLGETTTDVRQGGARRYTVRIVYGCPQVRVIVADADGRVATWAGVRGECCGAPGT